MIKQAPTTSSNEINWMLSKSEQTFEGADENVRTISGQYAGTLPGAMRAKLVAWLKVNATVRDTRRGMVYNVSGQDWDISLTVGRGSISTQNGVVLNWNRYIIG